MVANALRKLSAILPSLYPPHIHRVIILNVEHAESVCNAHMDLCQHRIHRLGRGWRHQLCSIALGHAICGFGGGDVIDLICCQDGRLIIHYDLGGQSFHRFFGHGGSHRQSPLPRLPLLPPAEYLLPLVLQNLLLYTRAT